MTSIALIDYNIISTGSQGNAVIIEKVILIDCGVGFKSLKPFYSDLRLVLLTHIHSDHFNKRTIRRLAAERPTLRFACCRWLVEPLTACGVSKNNIDVLEFNRLYGYGLCNVIPVPLVHNVPNCGWKIHFAKKGKMIYCTDTNNMNGIMALNYDLFMIEANYDENEIEERIRQKKENGEYAYELQVLKNHLSKQKCDDFIYRNIGPNGVYVYMHRHIDKEVSGIDNDSENTQGS